MRLCIRPTAWRALLILAALAASTAQAQVGGSFGAGGTTTGGGGVSAEVLAYGGYCGVTLRDKKTWVTGNPAYTAQFDGRTYRFAGAAELQTFNQNKLAYVPALGGDCIVTYKELGQRVPGNLNHGVFGNNRYHFFVTAEQSQKFRDNSAAYIDVDVALEGIDPVVLVENGQQVAGRPELVEIYQDFRYFFSSQQSRQMFAANPAKYSESAIKSGSSTIPPGLEAFCPVTIKDLRRWVDGQQQFAVNFDGRTYFFPSQTEATKFEANPFIYAPVLQGDCVVTYKAQGQRKLGSVYHAAFYRERLYLFPSEDEKRIFKTNPASYVDADLANSGQCIVSQVDARRQLPGDPRFTIMHKGLRYQFASQNELAVFNANPSRYEVR